MDRVWLSIDTGGTFTDMAVVRPSDGLCFCHKVPTRTEDPAQGILDGMKEMLALARVPAGDVELVVLGTTLATNAVLEKQWARTGMLVTRGFRDVLDLARQRRPHYFNLDLPKPEGPAAVEDRYEVGGRLAYDGEEVLPLAEEELDDALNALKEKRLPAVAVCFMHSYQNPAHEREVAQRVRSALPGAYVCASSDILPEFREYERFSTTVVNASLMPVMDDYLARFEAGVAALGVASPPRVMQSNGGAVTAGTVRKQPINTFFSGPAGGVVATGRMGERAGRNNLITFDMGGTSTDVCLIRQGNPARKSEQSMGGMPVRTRILDIHTIGAGGGSLAWMDAGGLMKVGPRSAGAYPGPAAYGRGGEQPTVTDANVVLGRLNPVSLLNGRMQVHPGRARAAIENTLCRQSGIGLTEAAAGILQIANTHMTGAVRVISVEQGEDPRDYSLVAFGGAGPLHAVDVALLTGMRHVIVPPRPGIFSAQGLLEADQRADFSLTRLVPAQASSLPRLAQALDELQDMARDWRREERVADDGAVEMRWQIDLRYAGQNSELIVGLDEPAIDEARLERLVERFHMQHREAYGYDLRQQAVEIVTVRLAVVVRRPQLEQMNWADAPLAQQQETASRPVWFAATGFVETPVVRRERLAPGQALQGPIVIEQMDATTVAPPGARVSVDQFGYINLDLTNVEGVAEVVS